MTLSAGICVVSLPARGRDVAAARVDADDDALAERAEDVVEEVDVGVGRGAEDHALGAGAQRVADRRQRAQAAAVLDRHVSSWVICSRWCRTSATRCARRRGRRRAGTARPPRPTRARPPAASRGRRSSRRSRPSRAARPCPRRCRSPGRGSRRRPRADRGEVRAAARGRGSRTSPGGTGRRRRCRAPTTEAKRSP